MSLIPGGANLRADATLNLWEEVNRPLVRKMILLGLTVPDEDIYIRSDHAEFISRLENQGDYSFKDSRDGKIYRYDSKMDREENGIYVFSFTDINAVQNSASPMAVPISASLPAMPVVATTQHPTFNSAMAETTFAVARLLHKPNGQSFSSPLSLAIALSVVLNGAEGRTKDQMLQALSASGMSMEELNRSAKGIIQALNQPLPGVEIKMGTSLWVGSSYKLLEPFVRAAKENFDAHIATMSPSDPTTPINAWVQEATNGKIQSISGDVDPLLSLLVLNAIYFKGSWLTKFNEQVTRPETFYNADGNLPKVHLMFQQVKHQYTEAGDYAAVRLPYGEDPFSRGAGDFGMTVILPHEGRSVENVLEQLNANSWEHVLRRSSEREVKLHLPRFKFEQLMDLKGVMQSLGMTDAFIEEQANLTGITEPSMVCSQPWIDYIKQKAGIEVNEEGTVAYALSEVGVTRSFSVALPPVEMRVDRPFAFVLDYKGLPLFVGTIEGFQG